MSTASRLENLGRLQEKKARAIELAILIHRLRQDINQLSNPHRPLADFKLKEVSVLLGRMEEASFEHTRLCKEIRELCEDLGEPLPNLDLEQ